MEHSWFDDGHLDPEQLGTRIQERAAEGRLRDIDPLNESAVIQLLKLRERDGGTRAQGDFNRDLVHSLELIVQHLQQIQNSLTTVLAINEGLQADDMRQDIMREVAHVQQEIMREVTTVQQDVQRGLVSVQQNVQQDIMREVAHVQQEIMREVTTVQQNVQRGEATEQQNARSEIDNMLMRIRRLERTRQPGRTPREASLAGGQGATSKNRHDAETGAELTQPQSHDGEGSPDADAGLAEFDYFLFESRFRGSVSEIRSRQRAYVSLFADKKNVLDVACGRGEFVGLLAEHHVNVTGVDLSIDMVASCLDQGLNVVHADAFAYLRTLPDASLDGIFAAQFVEHLSPGQIITLLRLCAEKLQPGGIIVAETVNPSYVPALSNFYMDPTHIRPVPPNLLWFLFESGPFTVQRVKFTSPGPDSDEEEINITKGPFYVPTHHDYAVIAVRS